MALGLKQAPQIWAHLLRPDLLPRTPPPSAPPHPAATLLPRRWPPPHHTTAGGPPRHTPPLPPPPARLGLPDKQPRRPPRRPQLLAPHCRRRDPATPAAPRHRRAPAPPPPLPPSPARPGLPGKQPRCLDHRLRCPPRRPSHRPPQGSILLLIHEVMSADVVFFLLFFSASR
ncbi:hypothetical protein GUJ93_ZPchr0008g11781 [Zizania palustris]|uniref:Uncharacterized protein n=1 Tax=Zizania palustris TaxID=103762 RepID=A0A8J5RES3_ZIZPA|nr:hypothetical protein GUJ93_ZPchr0008g11781 [Zizania palustris]